MKVVAFIYLLSVVKYPYSKASLSLTLFKPVILIVTLFLTIPLISYSPKVFQLPLQLPLAINLLLKRSKLSKALAF